MAGAKSASHAVVGMGVGDGAEVSVGEGVPGCTVGGTVVTVVVGVVAGAVGVVAGVVTGAGVETGERVVAGVMTGAAVVCDTVVPSTVKLMMFESGA